VSIASDPVSSAVERFAVSFVESKFDNKPRRELLTWDEIVNKLTVARRTACTVANCGTGVHAELDKDGRVIGCRHKNGRAWIPATFTKTRKKEAAEHVSLLVVDLDHLPDNDARDRALARLEQYCYVAHATHSDRTDNRCGRVTLPLSIAVPAADWPRFWPAAMAFLGMPADPSCCDASRLYYLPARPSDADFWCEVHGGQALDVAAIIATAPAVAPTIASSLTIADGGMISTGQRHAALKSTAGAMRHRGAGESEILAVLRLTNQRCDPPKPDSELADLAKWAAAQPITTLPKPSTRDPEQIGIQPAPILDDIPPPGDGDAPHDDLANRRRKKVKPVDAGATDHAGIGPMGGYRLTDLGNARRFADANRDQLRHVPEWGWLGWDRRRFCRDVLGAPVEAAKRVAASIYADAAACAATAAASVNGGDASFKGAPVEEMAKFARGSSKRSAIESMIALARTEPEIATRRESFDADPFLLNVLNGTINLREGELRPHRQSDMLTKLAPVDYDPAARAPQWESFLERVQPDPEVRAWLQRFLGYTLTGDVREQAIAFLLGAGANGKSVLLDVTLGVLGDYGLRAAPDLVLAKHGEAHPTELADLDGKRLVVCSEIEQGRMWAESTIKRITGDTTVTARRMRQDFYTFPATHKLVVAANTKPKVRGTDHGIWRRMKLVPWAVRIPTDEQDRELPAKLLATEASGVLAWLVRGCLAWLREGLGTARAIDDATADYRADQDTLGRWIAERCDLRNELWQGTSGLYENYTAWSKDEGSEPWTRNTWRTRMLERDGIGEGMRDHGRVRALTGIALKAVR
jgi:putative DNA primase/helicase